MPRRALGCAGRAAGQQHDGRGLARDGRDLAGVRDEQPLDRVCVRLPVGPREQPPVPRLKPAYELRVLLIVDQQGHPFPLAHIAQLGSGEVGVQVQDPRSHLGGTERGVEKAAVIPAEDPDARALAHAAGAQRARECVGARVQPRERQRSALIHQADALAVADRGHRDRTAELSKALERSHRGDRAGGGVEYEQPGAARVRGSAGLVGHAPGEPCPHGLKR